MVLLRLDVAALLKFGLTHPHINELMLSNAEMLSRMNLIKHAASFAKLSIEKIHWLAERIGHDGIP